MQDQQVWDIIDAAREAAGADQEARPAWLHAYLVALSNEELLAFSAIFNRLRDDAFRWDLWGAAYVMNGGCSDDSFIDFRSWLISEGREVYEAALRDPDSLAALPRVDDCMLEEFGYVTGRVLEKRQLGACAVEGFESKTGENRGAFGDTNKPIAGLLAQVVAPNDTGFSTVLAEPLLPRKLLLPLPRQGSSEPAGTSWDEDELPALFPRLSALYTW